MARPKNFSRTEVLEKAIPVFWRQGYAKTALQDLEKATGVNKSGLYSEFKDKDDLFVQSLRHYVETRGIKELLAKEPLGWHNVEKFVRQVFACSEYQGGCFTVSTVRELEVLPNEASEMVNKVFSLMKKSLAANIAREKTQLEPDAIAELIFTFYTGLCVEQNLKTSRAACNRKIDQFLQMVKKL